MISEIKSNPPTSLSRGQITWHAQAGCLNRQRLIDCGDLAGLTNAGSSIRMPSLFSPAADRDIGPEKLCYSVKDSVAFDVIHLSYHRDAEASNISAQDAVVSSLLSTVGYRFRRHMHKHSSAGEERSHVDTERSSDFDSAHAQC